MVAAGAAPPPRATDPKLARVSPRVYLDPNHRSPARVRDDREAATALRQVNYGRARYRLNLIERPERNVGCDPMRAGKNAKEW